jgi:hypothetical protein
MVGLLRIHLSALVVAVLLLTSCTSEPGPNRPSSPGVSVHPEPQPSVAERPEIRAGDAVKLERRGSGNLDVDLSRRETRDFILYVRCVGGGSIQAAYAEPTIVWNIPCDGIVSRRRSVLEQDAIHVRLVNAEKRPWYFVFALGPA